MKAEAPFSRIAEILQKHTEGLSIEQISVKTGIPLTDIQEILKYFEKVKLITKVGDMKTYVVSSNSASVTTSIPTRKKAAARV